MDNELDFLNDLQEGQSTPRRWVTKAGVQPSSTRPPNPRSSGSPPLSDVAKIWLLGVVVFLAILSAMILSTEWQRFRIYSDMQSASEHVHRLMEQGTRR